jgi:hypothetical protein
MKYILLICFTLYFESSFGQADSLKVVKDSLLASFLKDLPTEMHKEFIEEYKNMTPDQKKQMLELKDFFSPMPTSSKKQLIQNVDTNYSNILALKTYFKSIIPTGLFIYIEFKSPEKILNLDESLDFWAFREDKISRNTETIFQEWNVELKSSELDSLLNLTPLKRKDLQELKKYLDKAHCISVSNRREFEIGFARSGMGKYSYLIFDKPLTRAEQEKYNNGCEYIFYKDNIVLEYGGGAVGPQCFPDKK